MGCIYLATNRINGKQYVGKTIYTIEKRRKEHEIGSSGSILLWKAICKYGKEVFDWDEVYSDVPEQDLDRLEIESIAWFGTVSNGYNLSMGGGGCSGCHWEYNEKQRMERSQLNVQTWDDGEVRYRRCEGIRKAWSDPVVRKRITLALDLARSTPEFKANHRAACKKVQSKSESKAKQREIQNRPEVQERRRASLKRTNARPEVRARRSRSQKEAQNRPEVKARMGSIKKRWLERKEVL